MKLCYLTGIWHYGKIMRIGLRYKAMAIDTVYGITKKKSCWNFCGILVISNNNFWKLMLENNSRWPINLFVYLKVDFIHMLVVFWADCIHKPRPDPPHMQQIDFMKSFHCETSLWRADIRKPNGGFIIRLLFQAGRGIKKIPSPKTQYSEHKYKIHSDYTCSSHHPNSYFSFSLSITHYLLLLLSLFLLFWGAPIRADRDRER